MDKAWTKDTGKVEQAGHESAMLQSDCLYEGCVLTGMSFVFDELRLGSCFDVGVEGE
jgi:hypothetical protein